MRSFKKRPHSSPLGYIALPSEPFPFLEDELLTQYVHHKPRNFDATDVVLKYCGAFVHVPDSKNRWAYIREDHATRITKKAGQVLNFLKKLGLVKPPPKFYSNHLQYLNLKGAKRRVDLSSVKKAFQAIDYMLRDGKSTWQMAKELNVDELAHRSDTSQKYEYIRSKHKDYRAYLRKSILALTYATPEFYASDS